MNLIVRHSPWELGPLTPYLNKKMVHIWRVSLPVSERVKGIFLKTLSEAECERMEQFRFDRDKERYLIARGGLREIIARYLSVLPVEIEFHTTEYGKPYINEGNLHFNLSHSENAILAAFSNECPIGIDVEHIREDFDLLSIASQFCSTNEYDILLNLGEDARRLFFYRLWTHKEALVKAMGYGLSFPLKEIEVSFLPCKEAKYGDTLWKLEEIKLPDNYMAAFATKQKYSIRKEYTL